MKITPAQLKKIQEVAGAAAFEVMQKQLDLWFALRELEIGISEALGYEATVDIDGLDDLVRTFCSGMDLSPDDAEAPKELLAEAVKLL